MNRPADYTLMWLDVKVSQQGAAFLEQVQEARSTGRYTQAIQLCQSLTGRAEIGRHHDSLGLVYCQLGETYRLMGTLHYQEALDAFGKARLHFALSDQQLASLRNMAVAHWSQAILLEVMPGEWPDALRQYQAAQARIRQAADRAQHMRVMPSSQARLLAKALEDMRRLIDGDYGQFLQAQTPQDPHLASLRRTVQAAEATLARLDSQSQTLIERAEQISDQSAAAADRVTRSAVASQQAARWVVKAGQEAAQQHHQQGELTGRLEDVAERMEILLAQMGEAARVRHEAMMLIVPAPSSLPVQAGDYLAVQANGNEDEALLEGKFELIGAADEQGETYHFRRTATDQIIMLPAKGGATGAPVELPGQVVGVLRKVTG